MPKQPDRKSGSRGRGGGASRTPGLRSVVLGLGDTISFGVGGDRRRSELRFSFMCRDPLQARSLEIVATLLDRKGHRIDTIGGDRHSALQGCVTHTQEPDTHKQMFSMTAVGLLECCVETVVFHFLSFRSELLGSIAPSTVCRWDLSYVPEPVVATSAGASGSHGSSGAAPPAAAFGGPFSNAIAQGTIDAVGAAVATLALLRVKEASPAPTLSSSMSSAMLAVAAATEWRGLVGRTQQSNTSRGADPLAASRNGTSPLPGAASAAAAALAASVQEGAFFTAMVLSEPVAANSESRLCYQPT